MATSPLLVLLLIMMIMRVITLLDDPQTMREEVGLILRTKGFMWVATANDLLLNWSTAGAFGEIDVGGKFFAAVPEEEWPEEEETKTIIRAAFSDDPAIGDRRQEIVFIGQVGRHNPHSK